MPCFRRIDHTLAKKRKKLGESRRVPDAHSHWQSSILECRGFKAEEDSGCTEIWFQVTTERNVTITNKYWSLYDDGTLLFSGIIGSTVSF